VPLRWWFWYVSCGDLSLLRSTECWPRPAGRIHVQLITSIFLLLIKKAPSTTHLVTYGGQTGFLGPRWLHSCMAGFGVWSKKRCTTPRKKFYGGLTRWPDAPDRNTCMHGFEDRASRRLSCFGPLWPVPSLVNLASIFANQEETAKSCCLILPADSSRTQLSPHFLLFIEELPVNPHKKKYIK
jgi:hypothetical protein